MASTTLTNKKRKIASLEHKDGDEAKTEASTRMKKNPKIGMDSIDDGSAPGSNNKRERGGSVNENDGKNDSTTTDSPLLNDKERELALLVAPPQEDRRGNPCNYNYAYSVTHRLGEICAELKEASGKLKKDNNRTLMIDKDSGGGSYVFPIHLYDKFFDMTATDERDADDASKYE